MITINVNLGKWDYIVNSPFTEKLNAPVMRMTAINLFPLGLLIIFFSKPGNEIALQVLQFVFFYNNLLTNGFPFGRYRWKFLLFLTSLHLPSLQLNSPALEL